MTLKAQVINKDTRIKVKKVSADLNYFFTFQCATATIVMFYCIINPLSLSLPVIKPRHLDQSMTMSILVSIGRLMLMLTPLGELVAFLLMVT